MSAVRICVPGATGRMGRQVVSQILAQPRRFSLSAAVEPDGSDRVGADLDGATVTADLDAGLREADVYIDFTTATGTRDIAAAALERGCAAVIGTTGLDPDARAAIDALAARAPVLVAPNFSLGVNLLLVLAERAAAALGDDFDLEVVEAHHRAKRDAPSGTAIAIADALARGRGWQLDQVKRFAREGDVGPRPDREIGVSTVRGGDVAGEHTAFFFGEGERIELSHRATSRAIFAAGALRAAEWLAGKAPGHYAMRDVLGL